jgi:hypothetical protein
MQKMMQNSAATLNFGRFDFAVVRWISVEARKVWALCRIKQKPYPSIIPLASTTKQRPDFTGFFAFQVAASDATDNVPTWASCTGYIGRRQPLGARLANLVKVSHNHCRLSGITSALRNRINPPCALGLETDGEGSQSLSLAPLMIYSRKEVKC